MRCWHRCAVYTSARCLRSRIAHGALKAEGIVLCLHVTILLLPLRCLSRLNFKPHHYPPSSTGTRSNSGSNSDPTTNAPLCRINQTVLRNSDHLVSIQAYECRIPAGKLKYPAYEKMLVRLPTMLLYFRGTSHLTSRTINDPVKKSAQLLSPGESCGA